MTDPALHTAQHQKGVGTWAVPASVSAGGQRAYGGCGKDAEACG